MKRLLAFILIWGLLVVTGTLVSANSQTRRHAPERWAPTSISATLRHSRY